MTRAQVILLLACCFSGFAQTREIRGTVIELGPNTGLPGAEVTLTEFFQNGDTLDPKTFGTVFTDSRGRFSFKPTHFGDFRIDVKKAGYTMGEDGPGQGSRPLFVVLTAQRPSQEYRFTLMQPGSLSGRVVDENGDPVANMQLYLTSPEFVQEGPAGTLVVTRPDGTFTLSNVSPGPYVARVVPKADRNSTILDFTEDNFKVVDEDFETSYWPGGVSDPRAALPISVGPGVPADMGTITVRKATYYRAHVSVAGPCATGEKWNFAVQRPGETGWSAFISGSTPCRKEFILKNLKSGSYTLRLWNENFANDGRRTDESVWASAPLEITRENVNVALTITRGIDVPGHFTAAEGVTLPSLKNVRIWMRSEAGAGPGNEGPEIEADGAFLARSLPWQHYRIGVMNLTTHYVKQIRYNGAPIPDGRITLTPGAALEIVLDEQPAVVSGTVTLNDKPIPMAAVYLVKLPQADVGMLEMNAPYSYFLPVADGQFQILGVTPGDYRIGAISISMDGQDRTTELDLRERLLSLGERITLQRGEQKSLQLKAVGPIR